MWCPLLREGFIYALSIPPIAGFVGVRTPSHGTIEPAGNAATRLRANPKRRGKRIQGAHARETMKGAIYVARAGARLEVISDALANTTMANTAATASAYSIAEAPWFW